MGHDVFISYSQPDKSRADAVCSLLERQGVRCWIAPRDILPGVTWGSSIVRAIQESRILVLVFSSHSNRSPQVVREVERAVDRGIPIIPFRIEATKPSGDMEFFISAQHWLDAVDPPFERHVERLAAAVKSLLGKDLEPESGTEEDAEERRRAADAEKRLEAEREEARREAAERREAEREAEERRAAERREATADADPAPPGGPVRQGGPVPSGRPTPPRKSTLARAIHFFETRPLAALAAVVGPIALVGLFAIGLVIFWPDPDDPFVPDLPADSLDSGPGPTSPTVYNLAADQDAIHPVTVPPGATRTAVVTSSAFDLLVEAWRVDQQVDAFATFPEEVTLSTPGDWVVAVQSYDGRGGNYTIEISPTPTPELLALSPDMRWPHDVPVAAGESRTVTVTSTDFDAVLRVFERMATVDAHLAGTPEEVPLDRSGDWELIVRSYGRAAGGEYTLEVRD